MTPTIEAEGLVKRFGKTTALDGLDLVAEPGQVLAILGPNGAGKTTFVRAVATLLRPDEGTLRVAGRDVRREPEAVRRMIGLAGQFAAVETAMTGRENLEMVARLFGQSGRAARSNTAAVLEQLELTEAADRLVRTYSGGMRRKLDLGASLVGAPRLLLLDEPTTGLDPRARIDLWDAIRALVDQGTDVLLTTQYLDEADHLASQIVIIDHGRSVAAGHARRAEAAGRAQRDRGPRSRPRGRRPRGGRARPAGRRRAAGGRADRAASASASRRGRWSSRRRSRPWKRSAWPSTTSGSARRRSTRCS